MYQRRSGIEYARKIIHIQRTFLDLGFINKTDYYINIVIRTVNSLLPNLIREKVYKNLLRKNIKSS